MTMPRFKRLKPFYGFRALSADFAICSRTDTSHANGLGGKKQSKKKKRNAVRETWHRRLYVLRSYISVTNPLNIDQFRGKRVQMDSNRLHQVNAWLILCGGLRFHVINSIKSLRSNSPMVTSKKKYSVHAKMRTLFRSFRFHWGFLASKSITIAVKLNQISFSQCSDSIVSEPITKNCKSTNDRKSAMIFSQQKQNANTIFSFSMRNSFKSQIFRSPHSHDGKYFTSRKVLFTLFRFPSSSSHVARNARDIHCSLHALKGFFFFVKVNKIDRAKMNENFCTAISSICVCAWHWVSFSRRAETEGKVHQRRNCSLGWILTSYFTFELCDVAHSGSCVTFPILFFKLNVSHVQRMNE